MLQAGYEYMPYVSHEKLIEDNKNEYYVALRQAQTTFKTEGETIAPWITFFLPVLHTQAEHAIKLLSGESVENLLSPNQLAVWEYIKLADGDTSVQEITDATKVARPTVRQSIERLLDLKKIQRIGLGRATRYRRL
jgi:Fic family protein